MIRLLELRQEKGLTQREVAKALFVSQGTYNNWENGKTQPSIEQLIALSKFFGESIDFIVNNAQNQENPFPSAKKDKENSLELIQDIESKLELLKNTI